MDEPHQPVEYVDVAVHRDVDVLQTLRVAEVFLEVLHVGDQQILVALEVLVHLLVLVADVDDYLSATQSNPL